MTRPQSPDGVLRLAVIGAGPAGMEGAVRAADGAVAVTVIDAGPAAGGQFHRQPSPLLHALPPASQARLPSWSPSWLPSPALAPHRAGRGWAALKSRFDRHVAAGRVRHLADHHVWFAERAGGGFRVHALVGPAQQSSIRVDADALLLATGAYERVLPFPGWTLPGVVTAGGAQAMLKGSLVLPGREVVVAGTGPLLLPVAAGLAEAGAVVKALIESADMRALLRPAPALAAAANPGKLAEAAGYAARLAQYRIPVRSRHVVVAAHGGERVEAVTVAALDALGHVLPGSQQRISCDSLAIGHGLLPHLGLALTLGARVEDEPAPAVVVDGEQRTCVPALWAAGEASGVGGAALAQVEGEIAGRSVAAWSRGPRRAWQDEDHARSPAWTSAERRRGRRREFFAALDAVYARDVTWAERVDDDTTICRCEEVRAGAIRRVLRDDAASDPRTVKLLTRAGMGWCQGRMCAPAVAGLLAERSAARERGGAEGGGAPGPSALVSSRPFARPVPLGVLATLPPDEEEGTDEQP
ncbi:FAD-dependent oxidoreductase [Actinocrinis puniceicyclus]|uniref:FAD-dependent oxidoreductase n=1 Tax=Actinocrinis puniceicyclus TaxID=977794 RepID=A0A8J7WKR8_9ACTN|nr:NAD(P)/FAD-dependent oxidoreductase [Actinocrinis puniceicyclus]MBS2963123.1 FAD-dependent oxidoreductase [Actinocrinis puniceicyclus]